MRNITSNKAHPFWSSPIGKPEHRQEVLPTAFCIKSLPNKDCLAQLSWVNISRKNMGDNIEGSIAGMKLHTPVVTKKWGKEWVRKIRIRLGHFNDTSNDWQTIRAMANTYPNFQDALHQSSSSDVPIRMSEDSSQNIWRASSGPSEAKRYSLP